jgi:hypothetical protein
MVLFACQLCASVLQALRCVFHSRLLGLLAKEQNLGFLHSRQRGLQFLMQLTHLA